MSQTEASRRKRIILIDAGTRRAFESRGPDYWSRQSPSTLAAKSCEEGTDEEELALAAERWVKKRGVKQPESTEMKVKIRDEEIHNSLGFTSHQRTESLISTISISIQVLLLA